VKQAKLITMESNYATKMVILEHTIDNSLYAYVNAADYG